MRKFKLLGLLMALMLPAFAGAETAVSTVPFNASTVSNILDKNGAAVTTVTADTEISYFELTDPLTKQVFKFTLDQGENTVPFYPKYINDTPNLRVYYGNTVTVTAPEGVTITSLGTSNSSTATADKAAAQWTSIPEGQNNAVSSNTPWNWSGSANEITFSITKLSGRNAATGSYGQGITTFNLSYEGDFVYDKYSDHSFVIKSITPAEFKNNSSFNVLVGNGQQAFVPKFTFGRQKLDSNGNVLSEVEITPGSISKNPYCYENANLQNSKNATPTPYKDGGDNSSDPNLDIKINADNTATINIKTKDLIWQTPGRYIIIEIPENYFRALKVDGTYETFPAARTKYVYHVNPVTYTPIEVTLPSGSNKKLRFSMDGRINPFAVDYTLVIQDASNVVIDRIKTPTIEGNDVVFDMSEYKSGDFKYTLTDGSIAWKDADGGVYVNEGVSGMITGFEGAAYFDTFDLTINGYTKNTYGMYNDVYVGTVKSAGKGVGLGEFLLNAPAGTVLEAGEGTAELLRYDNNTYKYVSFPTPIRWSASDITVGKYGDNNVAYLVGPSVADVYTYEGFKLVVPAGFVKAGSLSNEAAELSINVVKKPEADMFTVKEDETDDGKYAIFEPKSSKYNYENLRFLPGMEITGYSTPVTTEELVDNNGSLKIDKLITESTMVAISAAGMAAVDADGNWTFNKTVGKSINIDFKFSEGLRYETVVDTQTWDINAYITGLKKNYFTEDDEVVIPESIDGGVSASGYALVYNVVGIKANTFRNGGDVKSVVLNTGLKSIEADAFKGATSLEKVVMPKVPTVANGAFNGVPENCVIYAPIGSNATIGGRSVRQANMVTEADTKVTLKDGYAFYGFAEKNVPVTYSREFNSAWQPLFLPVATSANDFLKYGDVARLDNANSEEDVQTLEWAFVEECETLQAHTPYIFRPSKGNANSIVCNNATVKTHKIDVEPVTADSGDYAFTLHGTYEPLTGLNGTDVTDSKFFLQDGVFRFTTKDYAELRPMRFYLTISPKGSMAPADLQIRNVVRDGDTVTAIDELPMDVMFSDTYYDLQGRKVENPAPGIYILNGRKVVIK